MFSACGQRCVVADESESDCSMIHLIISSSASGCLFQFLPPFFSLSKRQSLCHSCCESSNSIDFTIKMYEINRCRVESTKDTMRTISSILFSSFYSPFNANEFCHFFLAAKFECMYFIWINLKRAHQQAQHTHRTQYV